MQSYNTNCNYLLFKTAKLVGVCYLVATTLQLAVWLLGLSNVMAMLLLVVSLCIKLGCKMEGDELTNLQLEYEDPTNTIIDPEGKYHTY